MEKFLSLVFPLLLTISIFPQILPSYASPHDYIRPPVKGLVLSHHKRAESDPQQVHISLAGKDYIRVSWITEDKKVPSIVEYGEVPGEYSATATGETTSYNYFFYSSSRIHHVKIGPLQPDTVYYYRCGGFGPEFSLKTPPPTFPIEFVVVGDLGQTEWTNSTLAHVGSKDYDVFLVPGDLSYADTQQPLWDSFGRLVEPFASARPWMVTEGNHEVETFPIIQPHAFKAYNARWRMPYEESGSSSNLYYSFDVSGTHIIMLGSYTDFNSDSAQYKWLEADLSKIDRKKTPWVIALLHAPWYNTNTAHQGEGESMRKSMEELLYKARVDVVFGGHVHAYERFRSKEEQSEKQGRALREARKNTSIYCFILQRKRSKETWFTYKEARKQRTIFSAKTRIFDNKANPCGPLYITIGDGGNREGLTMNFKEPTSSLSMFREPSFGHGRLRILDESRAYWSWHRNNESNFVTADEIWFENLSASKQCSSVSLNDEL